METSAQSVSCFSFKSLLSLFNRCLRSVAKVCICPMSWIVVHWCRTIWVKGLWVSLHLVLICSFSLDTILDLVCWGYDNCSTLTNFQRFCGLLWYSVDVNGLCLMYDPSYVARVLFRTVLLWGFVLTLVLTSAICVVSSVWLYWCSVCGSASALIIITVWFLCFLPLV